MSADYYSIDPMKETEQTLLDQIKEQVAKEKCKRPFNHLSGQDLRQCIDAICERYYQAKAKASCEATLRKASENAKCEPVYDYSEERAELIGYRVKKSSIKNKDNIVIL